VGGIVELARKAAACLDLVGGGGGGHAAGAELPRRAAAQEHKNRY